MAFYPGGVGGKFILNCLALSSRVVLQDNYLALQQLRGQLTVQQKLQLLLQRLDNSQGVWTDLNLGCNQLFGDPAFKISNIPEFSLRHCEFYPAVYHLSFSDLYFASVSHEVHELKNSMHYWPNAKIINFEHFEHFVNQFRPNKTTVGWNLVKGDNWPPVPKTLDDYMSLPGYVKQELKNRDLEDFFMTTLLWKYDLDCLQQGRTRLADEIFNHNLLYTWNVDCVFDPDLFLHNLQTLYTRLELDDFSPDAVLQFRSAYLKKLSEIASSQ